MNYELLLRALLADVYKKQDTEIEAILSNTDENAAKQEILNLDRQRVSELSKGQKGRTFQDGYAKAKGEVLTEVENKLKDEFDINEDLKGDDLISRIKEAKLEGANTPDLSKLTTEDIKKLSAFQQIDREHKRALKAIETEAENKVNGLKKDFERKETFAKVSTVGLGELNSLNPVLPKTPTAAEKVKSSFLNEFNAFDWKEENGDYIAIDKETGNVVTDDHGSAITAKVFGKTKAAEWFDFQQNNGGTNGGNGKPGDNAGNNNGGGNVPKPKTYEEMVKITNDKSIDLKIRTQVLDDWDAAHAQ